MKNPVMFLLQFVAWLMLIAVVLVTWAGVTYPNGRAKAYSPEFSKIHPMCMFRVLVDDRYESSANLHICHTEYQDYPITVETVSSSLGEQDLIQVTASKQTKDGDQWVIGYTMSPDDSDQKSPFLINLFRRFPDGMELSSLAGISFDSDSNMLTAHMLQGTNDRCQGGYIEVMGMASRREIALSQGATLYSILNPVGHLLNNDDSTVHATFPSWKAGKEISNTPDSCVGRLIGTFNHLSKDTAVHAIAVDYDELLKRSVNKTELCVADAIVRAEAHDTITDGRFTVYSIEQWNSVLGRVYQRCGTGEPFNPINNGI
jgi:hypothetical protein